MCVITLVEKVRPTDEQVRQMWDQNPKGGGGVAWRQVLDADEAKKFGVTSGISVVRWQKGLRKDEMVAANKVLSFPYVLHFRQPSHDTSQSILACHPFQIDEEASTGFEGATEGYVLFHNGSWAGWRQKLEGLCVASGGRIKMASGAWSDTRGLALATHHIGFGFLEAVDEKVLCLGPGELDIEQFGGPWFDVPVPGTEAHLVCSNRTWERTTTTVSDRRNETSKTLAAAQAAVTPCTSPERTGGSSHQGSFHGRQSDVCGSHGGSQSASGTAGTEQKQVQEGAQGTVHRDVERSPEDISALVENAKSKCTGCGKGTFAGTIILGKFFCYQCWSSREKPIHSKWVGTCNRCKASVGGMKEVLSDEWICFTCWETHGKPKIYHARGMAA